MSSEFLRFNPKRMVTHAGLSILAMASIACFAGSEKSVQPTAKPGFTATTPTPEPVSTAIPIATECSRKGELIGLTPNFEGESTNSKGERAATARAFFLKPNAEEGVYIIAVEPEVLRRSPVIIHAQRSLPIDVAMRLESGKRAIVSVKMSPSARLYEESFPVNPSECNVTKFNWTGNQIQGMTFNDHVKTYR